MARPTWSELIGNIGTWKRGKVRAVNKPLLILMILARAQRKEANEVRFREIVGPLAQALRNFGPPRRALHPEYPFWYLQNDGFWDIRDAKQLLGESKSQPTLRTLVEADAVAVVPEVFWVELQRKPAQIAELAQTILDTFWPESIHDTIAAELDLDMSAQMSASRNRARDPRFRLAVLRAYERRCAICGFEARLGDALLGIEAAHIHFKVDNGPDVVTNGLALCSMHHKAFDLGAIGINRDLRVVVSQDLVGNEPARRILFDCSGQPMNGPQSLGDRPAAEFLKWHEDYVFRGPAREWA